MRNVISFVFTVILALFAFAGSIALAEDNVKGKNLVGWEQTEIVFHRTPDGKLLETSVTCTQVSATWSKCRTVHHNGKVEIKICNAKGCR